MKRQILSKSSIQSSPRGALKDALASSRTLMRTVMTLLRPRSRDDEPVTAAMLRDSLLELEAAEQALLEHPEYAFGRASSETIMLYLGMIYTVMARVKDALQDETSSTSRYEKAAGCFNDVPQSILISDEEAALQYLWALEKTHNLDLVVQFLVSTASFGKLPVSTYLDTARRLDQSRNAEFRTGLLQAALRRASGYPSELQWLANELKSEDSFDLAISALLEATRLFIDREELSKALACCEDLLSISPDHAETLALYGYLLVELDEISKALQVLFRAIKLSSDTPVRLSLAQALILDHHPSEALPYLDEILQGDANNIEALCLKAEAYNWLENWEDALTTAESVIAQHPESIEDAAIQKGIALHGLGKFDFASAIFKNVVALEDSDKLLVLSFMLDLQLRLSPRSSINSIAVQASKCAAQLPKAGPYAEPAAKPLIHVLRELDRWEDVIAIIDHLLKSQPASIPLILKKISAMRSLGCQYEALLEIGRLPHLEDLTYVHLKSALLCDIGDFEGALDLLVPYTNKVELSSPGILPLFALRAWADQNCSGDEYALDGEQIYRKIITKKADDYWSRKGLANALLRLKRKEEADKEYEVVIAFARQMRGKDQLDPYDSILAGWCLYCTNRFKEAAEAYESGLAAAEIGIAAQFDYALVLLADTSFSAARFQYKQSIADTMTKNPLRRCGLLYVSMSDLCNAFVLYPHIAYAEEAYENRQLLREALHKTLKEFPSEWEYLARRMSAFLEADLEEAEATKKRYILPRSVGFILPNSDVPCAILDPTLTPKSGDKLFHPLTDSKPVFSSEDYPRLPPKVLWLTQAIVDAIDLPSPISLAERLQWKKIDQPIASWAALTTVDSARDILDDLAKRLIGQSIRLLDHSWDKSKQHVGSAQEIALFAIAAACDETIKYQALIGYGAAGGAVSKINMGLMHGIEIGHLLPSSESLASSVEEFKKGIESRAEKKRTEQEEPRDNASQDPPANLIDYILSRVGRIAQIEDIEAQDRSAAQASTNMWLLVPITPELELCREKLSKKLSAESAFYLDDESVLALSREPAFYSRSVLRESGDRRQLYSIAFVTAAKRMQSSLSWLASALEREKSLQLRTL